ncbi:MAG: hypothetical protein ACRDLL_08765 [Solirubrobacterales bacterium]
MAPAAQASITGSHVTRPKNPRYLVYNQDHPNTFAVKGTTSGGNRATDKVDLLCFHGTTYETVASAVPLANDGSFSVHAADLSKIQFKLCRLRAVPAGSVPVNLGPFKGPLLGGDARRTYKVSGGPNDGTRYDFYVWAQQRAGAFDYDSLGSCGIDDAYLTDSTLDIGTVTFYCNAWLSNYENFANKAASKRSEVRVDGTNAYASYGPYAINPQASPGFPTVHFSLKVDPVSGDTTIHESEQLVKCPQQTFPPTPASCPRFVPTGVLDKRTIVQNHSGHLATITDRFKSTNGKAHRLDLLWQNDQRFFGTGASFDATTVAYRFPGQRHYSTHAIDDAVDLPKTAPAAIFVKQQGKPDGNRSSGRGAIVYDRHATSATFNQLTTSQSDFYLHQHAKVPSRGSAAFHFAYAQAFTQKAVKSLASLSKKRFR